MTADVPSAPDSLDIVSRLVDAGLRLFLDQGYHTTSSEEIAERAGVPRAAFDENFASKQAFAAAIVAQHATWMQRSWQRMLSDAPSAPLPVIRHVFARMVAYHERTSSGLGWLTGNLAVELALVSPTCREALRATQLGWRRRLADLIAAGQAGGEIRNDLSATALSALSWTVWEGALMRMRVEGSTRPLRESVDVMLSAIYRPADFMVGVPLRRPRERPRA